MGHILTHLYDPSVGSVRVPYCKILDMDELPFELYPELGQVFPAGFELFENTKHLVNTFWRMAELDLPSDDTRTSWEDPVLSAVVEDHLVIFVHISDVHREYPEDGVDLLWGKPAFVIMCFIVRTKRQLFPLCIFSRVDVGIFRVGCRRCIEHPAYLFVSLFELLPLLLAEHLHGIGEKPAFLYLHNVLKGTEDLLDVHHDRCWVLLLYGFSCLSDLIAYLVVECPHIL